MPRGDLQRGTPVHDASRLEPRRVDDLAAQLASADPETLARIAAMLRGES